jgi:hypothetical protein
VDLGTTKASVKVPALFAVVEPSVAESSATLTVSPEENPAPFAIAFVVGGPMEGEAETDAASTKVDDVKIMATTMSQKNRERRLQNITPPAAESSAVAGFIANGKATVVSSLSKTVPAQRHASGLFSCSRAASTAGCEMFYSV